MTTRPTDTSEFRITTATMYDVGTFDGKIDAALMIEAHLPPIAAEFLDATAEGRRLFEDSGALAVRLGAMVAASLDEIKRRLALRRAGDFVTATSLAWETYLAGHTAAVDERFAGVISDIFGAVMIEKMRAASPAGET